ncbi:MAG TPA: hypothetical protein VMU97_02520 [Candidatus Dormibacteraeota bacterium]|nr:hypothetical protein [Candidatus Dormibacteraeota bacterium]
MSLEQTDPKGPNHHEALDEIGVGAFAEREIVGPDGESTTLVELMGICGGIGQAIKIHLEGQKRAAERYGAGFDSSAAMEDWLEIANANDGELMRSTHQAANVDHGAALAAVEKK